MTLGEYEKKEANDKEFAAALNRLLALGNNMQHTLEAPCPDRALLRDFVENNFLPSWVENSKNIEAAARKWIEDERNRYASA